LPGPGLADRGEIKDDAARNATMTLATLLGPAVALLLLGAHFARAQWWVLATACVILVGLLLVRRPWVARIVQVALFLGAIEWARTLAALVNARMSLGQPHLRLSLILGAVAVLTVASALVFRQQCVRRWFRIEK
jgi:hypothetical protein